MGVRITGLDQTRLAIRAFVSGLALDEGQIGREIIQAYGEGVYDRSMARTAPDGSIWADNAEAYKVWKQKVYGHSIVGVLSGQMLSLRSLVGRATVGKNRITIIYGTGERGPARNRGGNAPRKVGAAKREATDIEKAEWFEADRPNKRARKFYGMDREIADRIARLIDRHIETQLRNARLI